MTIKEFKNSADFKTWKSSIVRRRLEKLDELLSSGEWISNSRMIKEINELYIEAPNDDIYGSSAVPHKIIESKELSKEKYESVLYMTYAGTIRQDRLAINKILRIVGKEHIFERVDNGDGTEGSYRYNTKYSIFDKYTINDIEIDDYEISKNVPIVINELQARFKTDKNAYLEEVSSHIEHFDFPTTTALKMLSTIADALRRARDINNNYISNLLDRAYTLYDAKREGWEKELLKTVLNAYYVASHPDADFDRALLFKIRSMLILAKDINSDYCDMVSLLRKHYEELLLLGEDTETYGFDQAYILYMLRHFVFVTYDIDGMTKELESYYTACVSRGMIIQDGELHFALKCLCFKGPEKWEYNSPLLSCVKRLISFFFSVNEDDHYSTGMLVSLFYLKLNIERAKKGKEPITEDEIIQLYIDNGWEHPMFLSKI